MSAAAIVATSQLGHLDLPLGSSSGEPSRPVAPDTSRIVRLATRPGFDVAATRVTRWSVTGSRFGTVSVLVPVGTTPRDALTVALAERGFQVTG